MINKNKFRISNDKKVLHKIGKRWVNISALTLALLGGGAVSSTTATHAAGIQQQTAQATKPVQAPTNTKNITNSANNLHNSLLTKTDTTISKIIQ